MSPISNKTTWDTYIASELAALSPILEKSGFTLDAIQPHTIGERFLMQAVTTVGGQKLILRGKDQNGNAVIIKATRDTIGKNEINHERLCRSLINELNFAYNVFAAPAELLHLEEAWFVINIQEYIAQETTFLERPLQEQFTYALAAFKAQEHSRATTGGHVRHISKTFGYKTSADYLQLCTQFISDISPLPETHNAHPQLKEVVARLKHGQERIEQYCGFLTHTDFVPHNFRIKNEQLYLLDFSAIRFGNKHEGWARFLNFMTLYNPALETALLEYVETNRAVEERESLQLMRLFRLAELITYYTKTLNRSESELLTLNTARIQFWTNVLAAELQNTRVSRDIVNTYQTTRDTLRSDEEKRRQQGLH
jgi:hypothetical protein